MVRICLYVHVCVAPPMIVGVAVVLWQLLECYYLDDCSIAHELLLTCLELTATHNVED